MKRVTPRKARSIAAEMGINLSWSPLARAWIYDRASAPQPMYYLQHLRDYDEMMLRDAFEIALDGRHTADRSAA